MLGQPRLRLIHRQCVDCGQVDSFEAYHKLVPPQDGMLSTLMAEVRVGPFTRPTTGREIQRFVQERWELSLPASSVGLIVHSFLDGVSALHQAHGPMLRQWLEAQGGLHVDGTCEPDTDVLFMAHAQPQGWTLEVGKMGVGKHSDISQLMRFAAWSILVRRSPWYATGEQEYREGETRGHSRRSPTSSVTITSWKMLGKNCAKSRTPNWAMRCVG